MIGFISRLLKKIFGTRNDRVVKRLRLVGDKATALEEKFRGMSDGELKATTPRLREALRAGKTMEEVVPEAFAACREAGRRFCKMRHFDVQLVGGQVLYGGNIAEMATGEGKTLVATLACYLSALAGKKVHVWSVNDYLVKRDRDWMAPIYEGLGLTVGAIQSNMGTWGEGARERRAQYDCDITYGTNNELGFDYLRDNMKVRLEDQAVRHPRSMAIVDEADSILIDEARTPLIISGPAADDTTRYAKSDEVVRKLIQLHKPYADCQKRVESLQRAVAKADADITEARKKGNADAEARARKAREDAEKSLKSAEIELKTRTAYYEVELDRHTVRITHEGIAEAQKAAGVSSFYVGANMEWPHLMEQSLRAHLLYERDKHYVVQNGEVKIVDEFTGRILEGRQWSDGLHQAVEAKERVRIKEETQTLATITIQNFARLYEKLAGMTGTAMTEAEEFLKIYRTDVISIPTNRPVNRRDHDDLIYQAVPNKYDACVDEIHDVQQRGRPHHARFYYDCLKALRKVYRRLVEEPGRLHAPAPAGAGELLKRIDDCISVLDSQDVPDAAAVDKCGALFDDIYGELAHGRPVLVGTTSIEKSEKLSGMLVKRYGVEHQVLNAKPENARRESEIVAEAGKIAPSKRGRRAGELWGTVTIATNMAGRGTDIKLGEGVVYNKCKGDLGPGEGPPERARKRAWQEPGVSGTKCCIHCPDYDPYTNCAHCFKPKLDARFPEFGRQVCPINPPCGLHIVGTERHEARRIDNQLRGRAGRQGDPGSSQFFLSLEDELLKIFMPDWAIRALKWMGLKEGEAIQDARVSRGIERAQKKVEERHFNSRKHLLEYDEVNNQQRKIFYGRRQAVLEGRDIRKTIWEMIEETVSEAVNDYFAPDFIGRCIADWARNACGVSLEPDAFGPQTDFEDLESAVRAAAQDKAVDDVNSTVGEFIDEDAEDRKEWDLSGLAGWAMSRFGVQLPPKAKLMQMSPEEITETIRTAAVEKLATLDCTPAKVFLSKTYALESLVRRANEKFDFDLKVDELLGKSPDAVQEAILERCRRSWERREVETPVNYALSHYEQLGVDTREAAAFLSNWVKDRYKVDIPPEQFLGKTGREIAPVLVSHSEEWNLKGRLEQEVDRALAGVGPPDSAEIADWCERTFGRRPAPESMRDPATARQELLRLGREHLRRELTRLEQRMLLDTYDRAWKDHLYNMDFLKENVGLQGWAERDPKNVYKKEGYEMFVKTLAAIRDRVTSRVFKLQVSDAEEANSIYQITAAIHEEFADFEAQQQQAMEGASAGTAGKTAPIVLEGPRVGRNDPCPCGSGKKYKKCCGRIGAA